MPRPNELRTHQSRKLQQWYRDPLSCLHTTVATVITAHGGDPLQVLGRRLGFVHLPGQVTSEEFYYPSTSPYGLLADLAPFHDVRSRWWQPESDDIIGQLHQALVDDELLIAAVDNFHLPYRPAFHDVHAAHLLVIDGIDEGRQTLSVSDAQPPAFRGHIELSPFLAAWGSSNPADDQDAFFSATEIEYRCLRVSVDDDLAPMTRDDLRLSVESNLAGLSGEGRRTLDLAPDTASASEEDALVGITGLSLYLDQLCVEAGEGKSEPLSDLYAMSWPLQAEAFLHGELLRWAAQEWQEPALAVLGRSSQSIASAWTNVRVLGAHLVDAPQEQMEHQLPQLRRRSSRLRHAYEDLAFLYERWLCSGERTL